MLFPKQKLLLVPTSVYNTPATAHFCQFQDSAPSPQAMQSLRRAAIWAAMCVAATWAVTWAAIAAHVTTRWPGCCGKVESVYPFLEHPLPHHPFPCPRSTEAALLFLKKARQLDSVADFVGITVGNFFAMFKEWDVWDSSWWEARGHPRGRLVGDFVRAGLRRICDLVEIAYASRIPPLVALVRDGNDAQKACAAGALGALAWNHDNLYPIAEAGGIPPLLALVRDGSAGQKEAATDALGNLAAIGYRGGYLAAIGIPMLVALVRSGNAEQKYNAADALRYFAMDNPIPIAEAGGIPPLVALVRDGNDGQKEAAAYALQKLAQPIDHRTCQTLITEAGGIPPLVALVRYGNVRQKEAAAYALANLADDPRLGDSRIAIAKAGGIPPLVALVRDVANGGEIGNYGLQEAAAYALEKLAKPIGERHRVNRVDRDNQFLIAEAGGIPPLVALVRDGNEAQKKRATYALSNFAYEHPNKRGNKILIPTLSAIKERKNWGLHLAENHAQNEYRVAIEEAWRCTNIADWCEDISFQ